MVGDRMLTAKLRLGSDGSFISREIENKQYEFKPATTQRSQS